MWDPALVIIGLVVSTPPKEEWHTVTFMTAALHHTQCVVHAAGINALHVLHSMQSVWTTRAMSYCPHPVDGAVDQYLHRWCTTDAGIQLLHRTPQSSSLLDMLG